MYITFIILSSQGLNLLLKIDKFDAQLIKGNSTHKILDNS